MFLQGNQYKCSYNYVHFCCFDDRIDGFIIYDLPDHPQYFLCGFTRYLWKITICIVSFFLQVLRSQKILLVEVLYYRRVVHGFGRFHAVWGIFEHPVCVTLLLHWRIPTMINRLQYRARSSHFFI